MSAENKVLFPAVKDGEVFQIGEREYIKFPEKDGMVTVVTREILINSRFGENNDYRTSKVREVLEEVYLPEMIEAVGEENLCTIRTDLTALSGQRDYGVLESLVSLPTIDFYRENAEIFLKNPVDEWWWLATPEAMKPVENPFWTLCVSPSGFIGRDFYCSSLGVRPFYLLKSSIFGSCEEENG